MNICVTGGGGFIGEALCSALIARGDAVRVLTRKDKPVAPGVKLFHGDLTTRISGLNRFVEGADLIYHCAGEIKKQELMHALHVDGTRKLLDVVRDSIRQTGKPVHWVQLSSVGAYGLKTDSPDEQRVITERSPHAPEGVYETTKTMSDDLVLGLAASEPLFTSTILRPSVVIGSTMPNESFFAMARMVKKGLFFYVGSSKAIATYIHVDDVVRALIQCGTDARARGQVFILSNDCPLSDVVDALADSMKVTRPRLSIPEMPLRLLVRCLSPWLKLPLTSSRIDALVKRTHYSAAYIAETLGFKPLRSIPEVVPHLVSAAPHRLK